MRILLTGSSGLIGRALRWRLRRGGHDVIRLLRSKSDNYSSGVVHFLDTADPDLFLLENFDAVIHLAGAPVARRWTPWRRRSIVRSRVDFTQRLCDALARTQSPPRHFLSASGVGYYGYHSPANGDGCAEDAPPGQGFLADVCRQWEGAAAPLAALPESIRPRLAFLRLGVVLSPDGGMLAKLLPAFRRGLGAVLGDGRQGLSWISIADAVDAIGHVLDTPAIGGAVNVTSPNPVTQREFADALAAALGRRRAKLRVPAWALKLALGRMADETLLASQRVLPAKLLAAGFAFRHEHLEAALRDLLYDANPGAPE